MRVTVAARKLSSYLQSAVFLMILFMTLSCESHINFTGTTISSNSDRGGTSTPLRVSEWTGQINDDWDNASNWSDGKIPKADSSVQINENCVNCDISISSPVKINSLSFSESFTGSIALMGNDMVIADNLSSSSGTTIHTQCANLSYGSHNPSLGSINSTSGVPEVFLRDASVIEGETLKMIVDLSEPSCTKDIVINYSLIDLQTDSSDHMGASTGQITVVSGQVSATLDIPTIDDSVAEFNESLALKINSIENNEATIANSQAIGTIIDNDPPPVISVTGCSPVTEGDDCTLTFELDRVAGYDVSFDWTTIDGTAQSNINFQKKHIVNAVIPAGITSISSVIKTINDFPHSDNSKTFNVEITKARSATIGVSNALITINNASSSAALALSPSNLGLNSSQQWDFIATGGTPPYTYGLQSGIGSIDASTGRYTAPDQGGGSVVVQVEDSTSTIVTANLNVSATYSDLTFCTDSFFYGNEGRIYDQGGVSGNYDPNLDCSLRIYSESSENIVLTVNSFSLGDGDSLTISNNTTMEVIATYTNTSPPPATINTGTARVNINFLSDGAIEAAGFDISYSALANGDALSLNSGSGSNNDWEIGWGQNLYVRGGLGPYNIEVISGLGSVEMTDTHSARYEASLTPGDVVLEVTDQEGSKALLSASVVSTPLDVTSLSKISGSVNEIIYLYGVGFQSQMEIYFGNNKCVNILVLSPTRVRCNIPDGVGTVDVFVFNINPLKTESLILDNAFTYDPGKWSLFSNQPGPSGEDRYGSASVWTGEHLIIWGGSDGTSSYTLGNYNDGVIYDALTDSWAPMAASGWTGKVTLAHVWTGTEFLIHSGLTNTGTAVHDGKAYNPFTDTWRDLATPPVTNYKFGRLAIWTGEEMIVTGGRWNGSSATDSFAYDPVKDTWRTIAGMNRRRAHHDMVFTGERVITYGGYSGSTRYGDVEYYNFNTDTWTLGDNTTYNAYKYGNDFSNIGTFLIWTGNRMVIAGGSGYNGDQNQIYNPYNDSWGPMSQASTSSYSRLLYTGTDIIYKRGSSDNKAYNTKRDEWVDLQNSAISFFGGGAFHNTGSNLYHCFGRNKTSDFCESFEIDALENPIFNLPADSWSQMSTQNEPSGREGHSLTWSGKYIILFGGEDNAGFKNDGYLYDPFKERWQSISNINAPSARKNHQALWLGERLFVWGGVDASGLPLNSGAIYHPELDTWTSVSSVNAPSARSGFAISKTNGKVVIWGGKDASDISLSNGAIYDFYADSWSAISLTSSPSGGDGVKAVFAGRDRIAIFGGDSNEGGILDVANNTWSLMSTANAPSASVGHSLIFSKNKVLVFGGANGSSINSELKTYDPQTNTWTTHAHNLTPRKDHISLMLGNRLFIFGGDSGSGPIGDAEILNLSDFFTVELVDSTSVMNGIEKGVWIGHIGENHFGYRNNHMGDTPGIFLWGGKSEADGSFLTNGVIYKPNSY